MSTTKTPKQAAAQVSKSFADHIGELRIRLAVVALVFLVASSVAYAFRDILVAIVLEPIGEQKLVYLTPAGGFAFIFQISMYAGAVVTAPVLVYHLYRFVKPALPERATRYSLRVLTVATLLMIAGVCFGYFVAVPAALHFLTEFAGDYVVSSLTADSYLNFIVAYVVGLGILFQLPVLLVFWNWISPIKPGGLWNSQRFVILGSFIAAAVITPTPDLLNQSMVAVPIIGIYQFGVIAVYLSNRRQRRQNQKQQQVAPVREVVHKAPAAPVPRPIHQPPVPMAASPKPQAPQRRPMTIDGFRPVRSSVAHQQAPRPKRSTPTRPSIDGLSRLPR